MTATASFDYNEFTTRNIGFVSPREQEQLRASKVFICGVGGMGGACIQSLARAGIGHLCFADFDTFDVSNINRQVFANLDTVGKSKVEATIEGLGKINPDLDIKTYDQRWTDEIDTICKTYSLLVNGMDDVSAGLLLYRKAKQYGCTVIDAYASPLPSVIVVKPSDPRPERRLEYNTEALAWNTLSAQQIQYCVQRELAYVMANSSSARHIIMQYAIEMATGERSRMSFAPMVITTGNLMCYEVINHLLNKPAGADCRGYFFNPYQASIERPRSFLTRGIMRFLVNRYLEKLLP